VRAPFPSTSLARIWRYCLSCLTWISRF
jgi:hypothetical protein